MAELTPGDMGKPFSNQRMKWIIGLVIPSKIIGVVIMGVWIVGTWVLIAKSWEWWSFDIEFPHLLGWWAFCSVCYALTNSRSISTKDW